jgi:hypothetical protein
VSTSSSCCSELHTTYLHYDQDRKLADLQKLERTAFEERQRAMIENVEKGVQVPCESCAGAFGQHSLCGHSGWVWYVVEKENVSDTLFCVCWCRRAPPLPPSPLARHVHMLGRLRGSMQLGRPMLP